MIFSTAILSSPAQIALTLRHISFQPLFLGIFIPHLGTPFHQISQIRPIFIYPISMASSIAAAAVAAVGQSYSFIFGTANPPNCPADASKMHFRSPSKFELAAEKSKLQSWGRILRSFRRHGRHHSPLYVLLSIKMECAPECTVHFDVLTEAKYSKVINKENKAVTTSAAVKVEIKTEVEVEAEAKLTKADLYCPSENSSTSDYKSASEEGSLDELTTTEDEDEETEEVNVEDALSFAVIQFTFDLSPSSESSSSSLNQVTFKGKTILNACKQMINFLSALETCYNHYKQLTKAQRSLNFTIDSLQEYHADLLKVTTGSELPAGSKNKIYWCQYELVNLGTFHSGPNYYPGPAKLAAAAQVVATLKALSSAEE